MTIQIAAITTPYNSRLFFMFCFPPYILFILFVSLSLSRPRMCLLRNNNELFVLDGGLRVGVEEKEERCPRHRFADGVVGRGAAVGLPRGEEEGR